MPLNNYKFIAVDAFNIYKYFTLDASNIFTMTSGDFKRFNNSAGHWGTFLPSAMALWRKLTLYTVENTYPYVAN